MRILRVTAAAAALLVPALLGAQSGVNGWATTGSRIRVAAPALQTDPIYGRLLVLGGDSLIMTVGSAEARMRLDLARVDRIEVSEGRERMRWAGIGALAGTVAGVVIGGRAGGAGDSTGLGALAGGIAGIILGLPLGATVGAIYAPERWSTAWRPQP